MRYLLAQALESVEKPGVHEAGVALDDDQRVLKASVPGPLWVGRRANEAKSTCVAKATRCLGGTDRLGYSGSM